MHKHQQLQEVQAAADAQAADAQQRAQAAAAELSEATERHRATARQARHLSKRSTQLQTALKEQVRWEPEHNWYGLEQS